MQKESFLQTKKHAIRAAFITYSNLNLLILHHARNEFINCKILEYYYNLSQSRIYDDNPFFWLQYAIASMELPDYPRANSLYKRHTIALINVPILILFKLIHNMPDLSWKMHVLKVRLLLTTILSWHQLIGIKL